MVLWQWRENKMVRIHTISAPLVNQSFACVGVQGRINILPLLLAVKCRCWGEGGGVVSEGVCYAPHPYGLFPTQMLSVNGRYGQTRTILRFRTIRREGILQM